MQDTTPISGDQTATKVKTNFGFILWTEEEKAKLEPFLGRTVTAAELKAAIPGRSIGSIKSQLSTLRIARGQRRAGHTGRDERIASEDNYIPNDDYRRWRQRCLAGQARWEKAWTAAGCPVAA